MPRPLRIEFENAWYHVMNRGANRKDIFTCEFHKKVFYALLNEISERFSIEIHAFCLMSNHYHLLVKTPHANLSRAMRHLDGIYTQRFNKLTSRDGALFRGRYKAILIDSDHYLLQVSRYIHLNPVSAKICQHPEDYKWSSYRIYTNTKLSIPWLNTNFTLEQMNSQNKIAAYKAFVNEGVDEKTNKFYQKQYIASIYGDKSFINKHLNTITEKKSQHAAPDIRRTKVLPAQDKILNIVMDYFKISINELHLSKRGRKNIPKIILIYLLSQYSHLKYKEIANLLNNLKEISIPAQIWRLKKLMLTDEGIMNDVIKLKNIITQ